MTNCGPCPGGGLDYGDGLIRVALRLRTSALPDPAFARFYLVPGFGGLRKRPPGPAFARSHPVPGFGGDLQAPSRTRLRLSRVPCRASREPSRGGRPFPADPSGRKRGATTIHGGRRDRKEDPWEGACLKRRAFPNSCAV